MQSRRFTLILTSALAGLACVGASSATARPSHPQTLLFDAIATYERTAGPGPNQVGHEQIASGILRNSGGHTIGRFAFTCTWIKILAGDDALERCTGSGRTRDGLLDVTGPARESEITHRWTIIASRGAYHGAHGTVILRDISDHETLITATVTPRPGTVIHVGVISRPGANAGLIARADELCARRFPAVGCAPAIPVLRLRPSASRRTATTGRSVLHRARRSPPDVPDPRFALASARPAAAGRDWWNRMLKGRTAELAVINKQDTAALNDDTSTFVKSVHASVDAFRQIAITATVVGATQCVL